MKREAVRRVRSFDRGAFGRVILAAAAVALLAPTLTGCDSVQTGVAPRVQATWGQLSVPPGEVIFRGATPRSNPYEERVVIKNIGSADLRITGVAIDGDQQFELADDTPQVVNLRPQGSQTITVRYTAIDLQSRHATLTVSSNDSRFPRLGIPVRNDDVQSRIVVTDCVAAATADGGAGACQQPIDDLLVEFGDVHPNQCRSAQIIVENAGAAELQVQAPVFQAGSSSEISFDGAAPGDFTLAGVDDQGNTQKKIINVKYCPAQSTEASATLLLASNDPANQQVVVTLHGTAGTNGAPHCVCNPSTLEIAPQDTVNLVANCTDPDNQPLQYSWTVQRRPSGSTEQIRNANSRNASFTANTATTANEPYVIRITATDTFGASDHCEYTIFATPRDALHIQLVWDKDVTDVDLHLLNPTGSANPHASSGFFNTPNDCYFADRSPDWGIAGQTIDNPRLDLDDTNGFGPENINLSRPASGTYTVGVHYYCDDSQGASNATVRIFCNGTLTNEFGPKNLPSSGFFWDVAKIQWPGCTITELDHTQTVTEGCTGGFGF